MREATLRRAAAIEAEHVLLALASDDADQAPRELLTRYGLDRAAISGALAAERERSLSVVGVGAQFVDDLVSTPRSERPRVGGSIRSALTAAMRDRERRERRSRGARRNPQDGRHRRFDDLDVLIGILSVELGTVPRALAISGVDREELLARARDLRVAAYAQVPDV